MNSMSFDEEPDVSLDLTPLIDAMFMLLIFFIMATTFSKPVMEVLLAKADSSSAKEVVPEKLTVTITEDGRILFDDGQVAPEDVAHTMAPLPKEAPIVFNVDKGAQFGLFVQVLDAAKGQDRANFVINTAPRDKEKP